MRAKSLSLVLSASLLLVLSACFWDKPDDPTLDTGGIEVDADTDADADTDTDTDADTDIGPEGVHGTITGTVTVTLYTYDEFGNITYLPWEDSCFGDTFPYGDIFVSAYSSDEKTGAETYYADDTLTDPQTDGSLNTYSLSVDTDEVDEIQVYAVLDKWFNRVIEPSDPVGIYAEPIILQDGETVEDVNIEILTEQWCGTADGAGDCPDCPPGWGTGGSNWYWDGTQWVYIGSGGGGCSGDTVTVGGALDISVPFNGVGDVGTFLMYPGTELVWWLRDGIAMTPTADGAEGEWGFTYCANGGTYQARGVWDDNNNGLYDPSDTWGQPVNADGEGLGSITFGETDEDVTMLIPVGGSDFDLVPFVRLSGMLNLQEIGFDDLLADYPDASMVIALTKYAPTATVTIEELEDGYDYEFYSADDLAGETSVPFSVIAPANTTAFLWANVDVNGDGNFNGADDACWAGYAEPGGLIETGDQNQSDIGLAMACWFDEDTGATE